MALSFERRRIEQRIPSSDPGSGTLQVGELESLKGMYVRKGEHVLVLTGRNTFEVEEAISYAADRVSDRISADRPPSGYLDCAIRPTHAYLRPADYGKAL